MNLNLLITESYLKTVTSVYDSVDMKDLKAHIFIAQDVEIQQLLGTKLYDELIAAVAAGSLSAAQVALNAKIQPCLAHYTVYYAYPASWSKFTNIGIVQKSGENSVSVDMKTLQYLREQSKNTAEFYAQRVLEFIKSNSSDYPSFYDATEDIVPDGNKTAYRSGMVF